MSRSLRPVRIRRVIFGLAGGTAAIILLSIFLSYYFFGIPEFDRRSKPLTRDILDQSLSIGAQFMLHNQKPEGNFSYQYDWTQRKEVAGDSQVRQAGAAWGLTLIYQDQPNPELGAAVEKAIAFFGKHSRLTPSGARYVVYPGSGIGSTGTVALCALAYIDYLRTAGAGLPAEEFRHYQQYLDGFLHFLISARTEDDLWHKNYRISDGQPSGGHASYYDGESLLALVKSARYMGRSDLQQVILNAAEAGYRHNIRDALRRDRDSKVTKGYYQWASMAFFELATSGWPDTEKYGDYVMELADWMIDVHKTLKRRRNTAYAYEGIIHAYELALQRQETERAEKYASVIEKGLRKLTSWQVGSPLANRFIRRRPTDDPLAIGGVQSHGRETLLRIDTTQHQMHAVILARRYVYK